MEQKFDEIEKLIENKKYNHIDKIIDNLYNNGEFENLFRDVLKTKYLTEGIFYFPKKHNYKLLNQLILYLIKTKKVNEFINYYTTLIRKICYNEYAYKTMIKNTIKYKVHINLGETFGDMVSLCYLPPNITFGKYCIQCTYINLRRRWDDEQEPFELFKEKLMI